MAQTVSFGMTVEMRYCSRCLMPSSRPRLEFTDGVCHACLYHEEKDDVGWEGRQHEFLDLLGNNPGNGRHDCIVPWNGGKDSSAVALHLKLDYGLNPLLVTYSPMLPTLVGDMNREALIQHGFDNLFYRPNQAVSRRLARRFMIERGNPEVHRAAGINALPVQAAVERGIKLIVLAEHGESEYGGHILDAEHQKFRFLDEVIEHQIGDHPLNWVDDETSEKDLAPYLYPSDIDDIKVTYFGYWHRWDVRDNLNYVDENIDIKRCDHGHSDGTWSDYDSLDDRIDDIYFHMQYIKFGFGRGLRDAARAIQNGHMTRDEGLGLVQRYDGEYPQSWLALNLQYLGMTQTEYDDLVDKHRNSEIWSHGDNGWRLKNPPR